MSGPVALVWDDSLGAYDFGPGHPLRFDRVRLAIDLARYLGLLDRVELLAPDAIHGRDLARVHDLDYLAEVQAASALGSPLPHRGLSRDQDTPPFPGMHEAAARVCAATLTAARAVLHGQALHAFSPAGGLHHARRDRAAGFCLYSDPSVAIAWLLEQGVDRVAYVDVDVHHGDGVESIFADDPRVLTVSVHESGRYLFPGTGFAHETGSGDAQGTMVNLPLPRATPDDLYLAAFDAVVPALLRAWRPQVLVTQLGCDAHHTDPLAHLGLTTRAFRALARRLHDLAHTVSDGRWVATGGGGYQWATVVPRAWAVYLAEMTGTQLPVELPGEYLRLVAERHLIQLPPNLHDEVVALRAEHRPRVEREIATALGELRRGLLARHGIRP